jgi:hypothetical protein
MWGFRMVGTWDAQRAAWRAAKWACAWGERKAASRAAPTVGTWAAAMAATRAVLRGSLTVVQRATGWAPQSVPKYLLAVYGGHPDRYHAVIRPSETSRIGCWAGSARSSAGSDNTYPRRSGL